jgi:hypothetical protein
MFTLREVKGAATEASARDRDIPQYSRQINQDSEILFQKLCGIFR